MIFLAELGDKSQLMALAFATRYRFWPTVAGIFLATLVVHAGSVAIGRLAAAALPSLDLRRGEVVGVNTLGIPESASGPVQGIFFAIPSNDAARITAILIADGQAARAERLARPAPEVVGLAVAGDQAVEVAGNHPTAQRLVQGTPSWRQRFSPEQ